MKRLLLPAPILTWIMFIVAMPVIVGGAIMSERLLPELVRREMDAGILLAMGAGAVFMAAVMNKSRYQQRQTFQWMSMIFGGVLVWQWQETGTFFMAAWTGIMACVFFLLWRAVPGRLLEFPMAVMLSRLGLDIVLHPHNLRAALKRTPGHAQVCQNLAQRLSEHPAEPLNIMELFRSIHDAGWGYSRHINQDQEARVKNRKDLIDQQVEEVSRTQPRIEQQLRAAIIRHRLGETIKEKHDHTPDHKPRSM